MYKCIINLNRVITKVSFRKICGTSHVIHENSSSFGFAGNMSVHMSGGSGTTSNKVPRGGGTHRFRHQDFTQPVQLMNISMPPPPPPPVVVNCGELRERHHGSLVELYGRVAKQRMGRFIELKDPYGITQLVAPENDPNLCKRFANMPIDSMISVLGYVQRRPPASRNSSLSTGSIEVHVEAINMVRTPDKQFRDRGKKRPYSVLQSKESKGIHRGITSREYKRANSENILKYFENREITCGELRVDDVGRSVTLVGWLDPKKRGKFMEIHDGYGHTQIVNDKPETDAELSYRILSATDDDVVVVIGRVMARPWVNTFSKSETGEIEVFIESFNVINPNEPYDGPVLKLKTNSSAERGNCDNNEPLPPGTGGNDDGDSNERPPHNITPEISKYTERTHNCGELNESHIGEDVELFGWLEYQRMRKFLTLRDGYGSTQIIIPDDLENSSQIENAPYESILKCKGIVMARPPGMRNENLSTGGIEVVAKSVEIVNPSKKNLPVELREFNRAKESLRLEYRYLDLRFQNMQSNLRTRSQILMKMREYLINHAGFVEVETPTLFRRTPGGAQEFVVPTRKPGCFYSLVQSPQQFKQMLMVGAIDRYFQIARCYRDEATRPDRQPEFTQLDIELSFTNREHVMKLIEDLVLHSFPNTSELSSPFSNITYEQAMENYGIDKPDTRFGLMLQNITKVFDNETELRSGYSDFASYAIRIKNPNGALPRQLKESLNKLAQENSKAVFYASRVNRGLDEWYTNGLGDKLAEVAKSISDEVSLQPHDLLLFAFGNKCDAQTIMGKVRLAMIESLEVRNLIPPRHNLPYKFLWVIDFPMFLKNNETGQLESVHHPFTAPHPDDIQMLKENRDLDKIRSQAYDLVLNGQEIGGGSIRIHDPLIQKSVLNDVLKIEYKHLRHMIEALGSGCPPHGGIALGIDRLMSIICDTVSIRDVIAFPKSLDGKDPLSKAPCEISEEEKQIYHISIVTKPTVSVNTQTTEEEQIKSDAI